MGTDNSKGSGWTVISAVVVVAKEFCVGARRRNEEGCSAG